MYTLVPRMNTSASDCSAFAGITRKALIEFRKKALLVTSRVFCGASMSNFWVRITVKWSASAVNMYNDLTELSAFAVSTSISSNLFSDTLWTDSKYPSWTTSSTGHVLFMYRAPPISSYMYTYRDMSAGIQ